MGKKKIKEFNDTYGKVVIVYLPTINYFELDANPSEVERLTEKYLSEYNVD